MNNFLGPKPQSDALISAVRCVDGVLLKYLSTIFATSDRALAKLRGLASHTTPLYTALSIS